VAFPLPEGVVPELQLTISSEAQDTTVTSPNQSSREVATETFDSLRIVRDIIGRELECDKAPEGGVLGFVNNAHPTAAQLFCDAVVLDGRADHSARILGLEVAQVNQRRAVGRNLV
jgi:hypothetical protein